MKTLRALLKLQRPQHENPLRLHQQEYEVVCYDYSFDKQSDKKGYVTSGAVGGIIHVTLADVPTNELMAWVFDHRMFVNGEITLFDNVEGGNENRLSFEDARCVRFNMHYGLNDDANITLQLTIHSQKLILGNTEFINPRK
jgi:hypothetical protein